MTSARKWTHRVGYITAALVAFVLLAVGGLEFQLWRKDRGRRFHDMERTQTHTGPLSPSKVRYRPDATDVLSTLPPRDPENGLSFVVMPSLCGEWFAYSLHVPTQPGPAEGNLNIFPRNLETGNFGPPQIVRFNMPASGGRALLSRVANLTKDWSGEIEQCFDGTEVAFELVNFGKITSGAGNSSCSEHYGELSILIFKSVRGAIPQAIRPVGKSWNAKER